MVVLALAAPGAVGLVVLVWVVESSPVSLVYVFVVRASVHACQTPRFWGKEHAHLGCASSRSEHGDDFILT
eukprot:4749671-Pyramimonas_sp.AAC.1